MATPDDPVATPEDPVAPSKVLLDVWRVIATLPDGTHRSVGMDVDFDDAEAMRGAADSKAQRGLFVSRVKE